MSIKGIDISNNDGSCDFSAIANDGVSYVYIKATEGKTFRDSYRNEFYNGCKTNGLKVGFYHFLVSTSSPEDQAENFYNTIKDYQLDLVPMMDIETNFDRLSDYVVRFVNRFKELCSWQLGVYSYTSFLPYIKDIQDIIGNFPFWQADYNNNPWSLNDTFFTNRIGHQYTEKGSISGVYCNCDVNVFTEGVLLNNTVQGWNKSKDGTTYWYCTDVANYCYYKSSWQLIDNQWFYFNDEGYLNIGWFKDTDGNWYYLNSNHDGNFGVMQVGWLKYKEKWCYLEEQAGKKQGHCYVDCKATINGKEYQFDKDGYLIENK